MDAANWTWGRNCNVTAVGNLLQGYITSEYGYMAIGWNPTIDLSSWDKLVVEVANTNGCGGEHYLIKAFLRDLVNKDVENGQMEAAIGPYEDEGRPYTLEINLKEEGKNVNLTACGVIGIQVQPNGAIFQISRVYLQKEVEDVTNYTLQLVSSDPAMGSVEVTNLLGSGIIDNGNGTYTVPDMAEVVIQATANPTYEFTGWREGNIGELNCYYCGTAINTQENPYRFVMMEDKAIMAVFAAEQPQVESKVTLILANLPAENRPADNNIELAGTFDEGSVVLEKLDTGWFIYDFIHASADATGKFRDKTNPNMVLCERIPANGDEEEKWVQAIFKISDYGYWDEDGWKGTACMWTEIDVTGKQYAWMENAPEPQPEGIEHIVLTEKAKKVVVDGMIYIVRDGKMYNVQGAQVK